MQWLAQPRLLLWGEGGILLGLSLALYALHGASWLWFLLLLAPDLSMLGYGLKYGSGFKDTHLGRV